VTEAVHQHCAAHGLTWPVDFASKGSSQVGGNIATNAGGVRVIRHGLTRQWVLGLQVVTASGEVLELNGALEKNNTGVDLRQLFIGSEGTLGVITEATLKLARLPGGHDVAMLAVPTRRRARALSRGATGPFTAVAYEFFTDRCLARVAATAALASPFADPHPCYVLLEVENATMTAREAWCAELFEEGLVRRRHVLAQRRAQGAALWALREGISESLSGTGLPHKNDVALPIAARSSSAPTSRPRSPGTYPDWEVCLFGHIGDGNLHVNVMKPEGMAREAFLARTARGRRGDLRRSCAARREHLRRARHGAAEAAVAGSLPRARRDRPAASGKARAGPAARRPAPRRPARCP
jgi:FAD/FMN-containing dehydrogenase